MNHTRINQINEEIDQMIPLLLVPLRTQKIVNKNALNKISMLVDELTVLLATETYISKQLVGQIWSVFTAMLGEAEHAKNREEIEIAAWNYQEKARLLFKIK